MGRRRADIHVMGSVLGYAADVCQILTLLLALPAAWAAVRRRARERRLLKHCPRHARAGVTRRRSPAQRPRPTGTRHQDHETPRLRPPG
jgi:hypothetical protein